MNELLISCADILTQASTPACATDYGERVMHILLSKTEVVAAGNVPTAAEFGTAYNAGTVIVIKGISNGHRVFLGEDEIEIVHKEWVNKRYRVEGKIRLTSEAVARMCERLNIYDMLYLYYITEKNYCFGPYAGNPIFPLMIKEGKGAPPYIRFNFDFSHIGIDYSHYDVNYDTLIFGYQILTDPDSRWLTTPDGKILIL